MSQENVERLRAVYSEWARGNFSAGGELFAREVVFEPVSDGRKACVGLEAVEAYMGEFLAQWNEFRVEAQEFVEFGEAVLVTERQFGKGKSSGIETEMTFYSAWTFRGGLVVRARWETNRAAALEAAGLAE